MTEEEQERLDRYKEFFSKRPKALRQFLKHRLRDFSLNLQHVDFIALSKMGEAMESLVTYRLLADQYTVEEFCLLDKMWRTMPVINGVSTWRNGFSPARYHYVFTSQPVAADSYRKSLGYDPFTVQDTKGGLRRTICGGPWGFMYIFSEFLTKPLEEMPVKVGSTTWNKVVASWRLEIGK